MNNRIDQSKLDYMRETNRRFRAGDLTSFMLDDGKLTEGTLNLHDSSSECNLILESPGVPTALGLHESLEHALRLAKEIYPRAEIATCNHCFPKHAFSL